MRGSFAILASLVGAVGQAGAACPTDICGDFSVAKTVTDAGSDNWSQCCEPGLNEDAQLKYPDSDPEACAAAMGAFPDPDTLLDRASAEGDKMVSMFKKSQRGDSDPAVRLTFRLAFLSSFRLTYSAGSDRIARNVRRILAKHATRKLK